MKCPECGKTYTCNGICGYRFGCYCMECYIIRCYNDSITIDRIINIIKLYAEHCRASDVSLDQLNNIKQYILSVIL